MCRSPAAACLPTGASLLALRCLPTARPCDPSSRVALARCRCGSRRRQVTRRAAAPNLMRLHARPGALIWRRRSSALHPPHQGGGFEARGGAGPDHRSPAGAEQLRGGPGRRPGQSAACRRGGWQPGEPIMARLQAAAAPQPPPNEAAARQAAQPAAVTPGRAACRPRERLASAAALGAAGCRPCPCRLPAWWPSIRDAAGRRPATAWPAAVGAPLTRRHHPPLASRCPCRPPARRTATRVP